MAAAVPSGLSATGKLTQLKQAAPQILPSMLLCDFGNLQREVARLHDAGVQGLHLDVMDGHFVPNMTYGLSLVETFRKLTDLPLDVHLMIGEPAAWVDRYVQAGADCVTFHIEATDRPGEIIDQVHQQGAAAGLAINPPTPHEEIDDDVASACDLLLVMSVMPGFGGQQFDSSVLSKLEAIKGRVSESCILEIDGGINDETIGRAASAGAELFVVGSGIFRSDDYQLAVDRLRQLASNASG